MDLADFLLARIAEDEELAQAARRVQVPDGAEPWALDWGPGSDEDTSIEVTPARVLTECDAKRRIVDWHRLVDGLDDDDKPVRGCPNCIASGAVAPYLIAGPCLTVRLLALPYADHPDYREEWKP